MNPRTMYALLAAGLLVATGTVFAQGPTDAVTLRAKFDPDVLRLPADGSAVVALYLHSSHATTVKLAFKANDGLVLASDLSEIALGAGETYRGMVKLRAPATPGTYAYAVHVVAASGAEGDASARVEVFAKSDARPEPARPAYPNERPQPAQPHPNHDGSGPRPAYPNDRPEPRPYEHPTARPEPILTADAGGTLVFGEDGAVHVEARGNLLDRRIMSILESIERRLTRLENAAPVKPMPPRPAPTPPDIRMTLSDADIIVSEDGGRVALLVQAGERGGRVPIGVRFNETSGWKVGLEQSFIHVAPHQRTWVWVELVPSANASSVLEYAVFAGDAASMAKGTATLAPPRIV